MKKILRLLACLVLCVCCFLPVSCGENYMDEFRVFRKIGLIGEYSGYPVYFVYREYKDEDPADDSFHDYYVDDVYIDEVGGMEQYYLFVTEEKPLLLHQAYAQGYLTHDDLLAIAERIKTLHEGKG